MKRREKQPNTVSQSVLRFIKQKELVRSGQHVIVAVSGGIDSMALLDILVALKEQLKITLSIAHVNHTLRGKASDLDEKLVLKRAKEYGIPFHTIRVQTLQYSKTKKIALQEAARELRYEFFENLRDSLGADRIATAHNADDNVETMLFHFFRGSGVQGLAGIPVQRDGFVRPLLSIPRSQIALYARQHRITFREDASNAKEKYTRNFIRKTIVPQVERRINPSLVTALGRESEIFTMLSDYVKETVRSLYPSVVVGPDISVEKLTGMHPFIQRSIVKTLLESMQIEPTFTAIESVVELASLQKGCVAEINGSYAAERTAGSISVQKRVTGLGFEFTVSSPTTVMNDSFTFSVTKGKRNNTRPADPSIEYVDAEKITFPLTVRSWKPGDVFIPLGMKGKKKLSDFFGEQKLTAAQKAAVPVVLSGGTIVWVGGLRLDDRCKITKQTRSTLKLSVKFYGK